MTIQEIIEIKIKQMKIEFKKRKEVRQKYKYLASLSKDEILKEIKQCPTNIAYLSKGEHLNDPEIIFTALRSDKGNGAVFKIGEQLRNNKQFIMKAIQIDVDVGIVMNPEFKNDPDIFLTLVESLIKQDQSYMINRLMRETTSHNEEVLLKIIKQYPNCYEKCPENFKNNKKFVLKVMAMHPKLYRKLDESLRFDKDIFISHYMHKDIFERRYQQYRI